MNRALLPLLALLALPAGPAAADVPADVPIYAVSLIGQPYRLGGSSPETGLDCSGFVAHVYGQVTGVILPRDSRSISAQTLPLAPDELLPGDLVFFNTLERAFSHVGIYLGDDRFVHAASSRSGAVMVSSLNNGYWRERYDGARRVTPPDNAPFIDAMPD